MWSLIENKIEVEKGEGKLKLFFDDSTRIMVVLTFVMKIWFALFIVGLSNMWVLDIIIYKQLE